MSATRDHNVMESLLRNRGDSHLPEVEELNCLIYRDPLDMPALPAEDHGEGAGSASHAGDRVEVERSVSRASIRIQVTDASRRNISLDRITDIAIKAILAELNRD